MVFDVDGTLLELHPAMGEVFVAAFADSFGLVDVLDDWDRYLGGADHALVREVLREQGGRAGTDQEVARVLEAYLERLRAGLDDGSIPQPLLPGARETLHALAARPEVGLAIATGNAALGAELRLDSVGLWTLFETGAFAEDGDEKTAILTCALARCTERWPGASLLYVGDHDVDAAAALANGVPFVRIRSDAGYGPTFLEQLEGDVPA